MNTTKNATNSIEVRKLDGAGVLVELNGEFDTRDLHLLRKVLEEIPSLEPPVRVDLSRVMFLDARCARELAIRSRLYGGIFTLTDPSWQVRASFRACGLGVWTVEHLGRESPPGAQARRHVGTTPNENLAVAV